MNLEQNRDPYFKKIPKLPNPIGFARMKPEGQNSSYIQAILGTPLLKRTTIVSYISQELASAEMLRFQDPHAYIIVISRFTVLCSQEIRND